MFKTVLENEGNFIWLQNTIWIDKHGNGTMIWVLHFLEVGQVTLYHWIKVYIEKKKNFTASGVA